MGTAGEIFFVTGGRSVLCDNPVVWTFTPLSSSWGHTDDGVFFPGQRQSKEEERASCSAAVAHLDSVSWVKGIYLSVRDFSSSSVWLHGLRWCAGPRVWRSPFQLGDAGPWVASLKAAAILGSEEDTGESLPRRFKGSLFLVIPNHKSGKHGKC